MGAEFMPGDMVILREGCPAKYRAWQGFPCRIRHVEDATNIQVADIIVDNGTENGVIVCDVPTAYLAPAPAEKAKRRGVLNLHSPKDDRSEAEKQKEGIAFLLKLGYKVLVSGQYLKKVQCTAEGCGHWFWPQGFGNSVGYPDVTLYHPTRWRSGRGRIRPLLIEYKQSEDAKRSERQIELAGEGVSAFVWSLPMLVEEVYRAECDDPRITPHPEIVAWLEAHGAAMTGEGAR